MQDKLIITKKGVKGEDGYKVFSIRIKDDLVEKLDRLAQQTNRSRNDLIKEAPHPFHFLNRLYNVKR